MLDVRDLPALNASLNALATLCLVAGYFLIRQGRRTAHRNAMVAALACSTLFLTSYVIYHLEAGSVLFPGTGAARAIYLIILFTHIPLAAAVPVLAGITVWRAWKGQFARHVRIARWTLPIWLYVSVTGVVIYWMLYQMEW